MSCACQTLVSKPGTAIKNVSPKRTRRKNLMNEIERRDIQQLKNMGFESCDPRFQEHLFVGRHKTPRRIDSTSRAALHTKSNHTFLAPIASLTTGGPALSPFRPAQRISHLICFLRPLHLRYNFFSRQMHRNELIRGFTGQFFQFRQSGLSSHDGSSPYASPVRQTLEQVIFSIHVGTL